MMTLHRSVIVIEQAKQRATTGLPYPSVTPNTHIVENWTEKDQKELEKLLSYWSPKSGLAGLSRLLDNHSFSDGETTTKTELLVLEASAFFSVSKSSLES